MSYTAKDIRNICLLGHGGDGKTALAESMLFLTKGTDRLGKSADGNTVSDFDPEEVRRGYSISTSVIPVEYNKTKLNILDNPGYFDFAGEVVQSLRVVDSGLICLTAKSGIGVGTEKGWKYLKSAGLPAMFYVSKMDEEHANFFTVFDSLRSQFGTAVIPFTFPIMDGEKAVGLVDLLTKTAQKADGSKMDLPADAQGKIDEYMEMLNEAIAETSEELMEKYFGGEAFTEEELLAGVKEGVKQRSVCPVFCGCAMTGLGTMALIDNLVKYAPNPLEGKPMTGLNAGGEEVEVALDPDGSPMAFVFKTINDQFGKNSYFKVFSGTMTDTTAAVNARTGDSEKLGNMFFPKGKNNAKTSAVACGTILIHDARMIKITNTNTATNTGIFLLLLKFRIRPKMPLSLEASCAIAMTQNPSGHFRPDAVF